MARLAQEREDGFLDTTLIISQYGRGADTTMTSNQLKKKGTQATGRSNNSITKGSAPKEIMEIKKSTKIIDHAAEISQELKPKRRVLNKTMDNPLLRPLDCKSHNKASASFATDLETTSWREPSRPKARQNDKFRNISRFEARSIESDSEGLSSFVVNDSFSLGEESSDSGYQSPLPRSTRRLVRGRRRRSSGSLHEVDVSRPVRGGQVKADEADSPAQILHMKGDHPRDHVPELSGGSKKNSRDMSGRDVKWTDPISSRDGTVGSALDRPFSLLQIPPSGHKTKHTMFEELKEKPPYSSPKMSQNRLVSPKRLPQIPPTPHRPSIDAFWSQDVVNEWNDEYSPKKVPKMRPRLDHFDPQFTLSNKKSSPKSPSKRSHDLIDKKKTFVQNRHALAEEFLHELDSAITDGRLSQMAASTGGVKVIWSRRLNTTAGRANWKLETIRSNVASTDDKLETRVTYRHHASIELAAKVIDSEDRLLNVIAHEFCHLANFMLSGIKNNPHGKEFKAWAAKCSDIFGDRGILVTTKHSYEIDYKYVWECSDCGMEFKRHSKSVDPLRHQCGSCKGKLVQTKPELRPHKIATEYQIFIKTNMKRVKDENPGSPQKDIMGLLGKMYQEHKESKRWAGRDKSNIFDINAEDDSAKDESIPSSRAIDAVARKLNFLDLTSQ